MAVVIGLMSGTSLDGLDICCARFSKNLKDFQILAYATIPYTLYWREKLENAFYNRSTELDQLDKEYGEFLGHAVADFLPQHKLPKVDLISSHGHTVFHDPEKGITKQIGSGYEIAKKTGIPVVYDFRSQDVGLGGQGAPLVPRVKRLVNCSCGFPIKHFFGFGGFGIGCNYISFSSFSNDVG